MRLRHRKHVPRIHPMAYVAPNAVVSGDVRIAAGARVLFGAVITSEGGPVEIGSNCIVMENAVIRGTKRHPVRIGDSVLIGPRAYLSGCTVEEGVFLATGSTVFNGAFLGEGSEVRVNGTVHLKTRLEPRTTVPIGWVAVGDPAIVKPASEHEEIWRVQEGLDFPGEIFGVERSEDPVEMMRSLTARYSQALLAHRTDQEVRSPGSGGGVEG